jgi:ribosomal protein S18 acetylase RimI-like enzyme
MNGHDVILEPMTMEHYDEVLALWREEPGVGLSASDEPEAIAAYLERNPGLSVVARRGDEVAGAALCGHDGRRGYLYHLVVRPDARKRGIGGILVSHCLEALARFGIPKCHVLVFNDNASALGFWQRTGGAQRTDLCLVSAWTPAR